MPLKITLKPHERMILAGAAITNGNTTANLIIENRVPILRKTDVMREENASTPARRIYFVIQLMYLDPENRISYQGRYDEFVQAFVSAVPSSRTLIDEIHGHVNNEQYYVALKTTQKLIKYEAQILAGGKPSKNKE